MTKKSEKRVPNPNSPNLPQGYNFLGKNIGIKDSSLDLGIIYSPTLANLSVLFTTNKIVGAPVVVGKEHLKKTLHKANAIIVNSKNANVYTGPAGIKAARKICELLKDELNLAHSHFVLPSSTGIIGVPLKLEKFKTGIKNVKKNLSPALDKFHAFTKSILTTDSFPKWKSVKVDQASIVGVAKGAGMVEPNLATMLVFFLTDAKFNSRQLKKMLQRVSDQTFNSLTIDGDMSTSDTVALMANGLAGPVPENKFVNGLLQVAQCLVEMILKDGEGITKTIELHLKGGDNVKNVTVIAKSILNSFLVKTAFYGNDPNWGRIIMAIGKTKIKQLRPEIIDIFIKDQKKKIKLNLPQPSRKNISLIKEIIKKNKIYLEIDLKIGTVSKTFWGTDLSEASVKLNSYYTT